MQGAGADSRGNLEDEGHSDIPGRHFKAGVQHPDSEGFGDRKGYEGAEEEAAPASSWNLKGVVETAGVELEDREDVEARREGTVDGKRAEDGGSLSRPIEEMGMDGRGGEGAAPDYDDIFDIFISPVHKKIGKGSSVYPTNPSNPNKGAMREASYAQKEEGDGRVQSVVSDGVALPYSSDAAPPSSPRLQNLSPVASAKKTKKKMRVAGMLL